MNNNDSMTCRATHNGGNVFEVSCHSNRNVVANLRNRTCLYKMQSLSEIPCLMLLIILSNKEKIL